MTINHNEIHSQLQISGPLPFYDLGRTSEATALPDRVTVFHPGQIAVDATPISETSIFPLRCGG